MKQNMVTACIGLTLLLSACGGRVSQPVQTTRSFDDKLSCEHLAAERANNDRRITELVGERSESVRDNFGMLISSPLFLDLKNAEKQEAQAVEARNTRLAVLMNNAGCTGYVSPPAETQPLGNPDAVTDSPNTPSR